MDSRGHNRPAAGVPPWLFIALILLIVDFPRFFGMLNAELADHQTIDEMQGTRIAVEEIEDVSSLFPVMTPEIPPKDAPAAQHQAWFEKLQRINDQRDGEIRQWLLGGACGRFRSEVRKASDEIEAAHHVSENQKTLLRKLIQLTTASLTDALRHLDDGTLRELIRREGWEPSAAASQADMISYLVGTNEQQRSTLRSNWPKLQQQTQSDTSERSPTANTTEVLSMKADRLVAYVGYLVDLGILLMPVAGLFTVLLPRWRGWLVERRFRLGDAAGEDLPDLQNMRDFVASHAPLVELRANLLHPGYAFVYPKGYRKPRVAVRNGMYRLWRSDPEAARGALLHEIEHVRQGDHLIVGYGSFFSHYLKWVLVLFVAMMLVELLLGMISSVAGMGFRLERQAHAAGSSIIMLVEYSASIAFLVMTSIMIALAGIWAQELNADYGANRGGRIDLRCGTKLVGTRWLSKAFGSLTHPPLWLRAWLIEKDDWARGFVPADVFPFLVSYKAGIYVPVCVLCRTAIAELLDEDRDVDLGIDSRSVRQRILDIWWQRDPSAALAATRLLLGAIFHRAGP